MGSAAIDENAASVILKNLIASKSIIYWLILLILIVKSHSINELKLYEDIWLAIHRHVLYSMLNVEFLVSYSIAIAFTCIFNAGRTVCHDVKCISCNSLNFVKVFSGTSCHSHLLVLFSSCRFFFSLICIFIDIIDAWPLFLAHCSIIVIWDKSQGFACWGRKKVILISDNSTRDCYLSMPNAEIYLIIALVHNRYANLFILSVVYLGWISTLSSWTSGNTFFLNALYHFELSSIHVSFILYILYRVMFI